MTSNSKELIELLQTSFDGVQQQKSGHDKLCFQPLWDIVNSVPVVLAELRRAERMRTAIERHDRFNRDDLGYSGPDDPAIDPSCGEDWQQLIDAACATQSPVDEGGR